MQRVAGEARGRRLPVEPPSATHKDVEQLWRTFENVNRWITHAEAKAAAALAASGVGLGVLCDVVRGRESLGMAEAVLAGACGLLLLGGGLVAAAVLWARPRLRISARALARAGTAAGATAIRPNLIHFDTAVRGYRGRELDYAAALGALCRDPAALQIEIARQVWANAQLAQRKFMLSNIAMACLIAGFTLLGATSLALTGW